MEMAWQHFQIVVAVAVVQDLVELAEQVDPDY
jgi:hypothetical protein